MERLEAPALPRVPELTGLPVTVNGEAGEATWWRTAFPTAWRGFAVAREPVLALAFGTDDTGTVWTKSRPAWGNAVYVELLHGPYVDRHEAHLRLAPLVWPPVRPPRSWEESWRRAQGVVPADGEIQVTDAWVTQGIHVRGAGLDEPGRWPAQRIEGETGRLMPLLALTGRSPLRIDLLVLPRRVLRTGRCGIWRLKPRFRDLVPEPLRHALCFGRAGRWPPIRWPNQRYGDSTRSPPGSSRS